MVNAVAIYRGEPKTNSWARWMAGRTMRQNKNNLVAVVGSTGSGKTYSAMSICEIMSKLDGVPFTIDHIVFTLRDLMDLINSNKLKKGSKIIFDEPQVSISSREFQSEANKVFNYLLSTFRHRNLTLFFCTPFETLLDKNTRKLFHAKFETISINRNTNTCRLKPRYLEHKDFKAEPYRKRMFIVFKYNDKMKSRQLDFWNVPKPSKELIEAYEKKKLEFTDNLNKNISERLKRFDEKGKSMTAEKEPEARKPLTAIQEADMKAIAMHGFEEASKLLNKSVRVLYKNKTLAEKKGYYLGEFKENTLKTDEINQNP